MWGLSCLSLRLTHCGCSTQHAAASSVPLVERVVTCTGVAARTSHVCKTKGVWPTHQTPQGTVPCSLSFRSVLCVCWCGHERMSRSAIYCPYSYNCVLVYNLKRCSSRVQKSNNSQSASACNSCSTPASSRCFSNLKATASCLCCCTSCCQRAINPCSSATSPSSLSHSC